MKYVSFLHFTGLHTSHMNHFFFGMSVTVVGTTGKACFKVLKAYDTPFEGKVGKSICQHMGQVGPQAKCIKLN
jgi:hypothetical protein